MTTRNPETATMFDQTIGVEVETICDRELAAKLVANYFGTTAVYRGGAYSKWEVPAPDGRKWTFVTDASINASRMYQCELNSPILTYADLPTLRDILGILERNGSAPDESCGIHIHVGLGKHTPATLRNLANIIYAHEDLLTAALGISHWRRVRWCKPLDADFITRLNILRPVTMECLAKVWYRDDNWEWHAHTHYDESRYHLLNLHAVWQKGTIEFRAFNSTLDADKLTAYIQLVLAISHQALTVKTASPKAPVTDNPAYTFRCWLLRMGMSGDEFKTARRVLMANLPGNGAWRSGHADSTRRAA